METIKIHANQLVKKLGIHAKDALHISCSIEAQCQYFITTDKRLLKKAKMLADVCALNPIDFIFILEETK